MRVALFIGLSIVAFAAPKTVHSDGVNAKRHYVNAMKRQRAKRIRKMQKRYRRPYQKNYCQGEPDPVYRDLPPWAACAFTPQFEWD